MAKVKEIISEEKAGEILGPVYEKALNGIPKVSKSVAQLADDYLDKNTSPEMAAKALVKAQVAKCGASGFLTGFGGFVTLPATLPANIGSVMYIQMRMVAAIAKIGGYDIASDQVQTMVYVCMVGKGASDILKEAGVKIGRKGLEKAIKMIPGSALVKINQKLGFRFITKFGEKGVINLGKTIPALGVIIGGSFDVASTIIIAKSAIKAFIEQENPTGAFPTEAEVEEIMNIDDTPVDDGDDDDDDLI